MKILKGMGALIALAALVSCGGGGGSAGTSPFVKDPDGSGSSAATSIDVLASSVQMGTAGDQVTITAVVKDAGNASLADAPVTFSADTGTLTNAATTTDSAGVATATLSTGADRSNRTIVVKVSSGAVTGSVAVEATGTKLSYQGATTVPLSGSTTVSVTLEDSSGSAIAGLPVKVSSKLANGLSDTGVTTDAQGMSSLTYTATKIGTDRLAFSGAGATVSKDIIINGENFTFVSPAADTSIVVGKTKALTVRYLSGNVPQANVTVNFAATAGTLSAASAVTDGAGNATVSISSLSASPATVQATLTGGVLAEATLPIQFVAETPDTLVLQVNPTAIAPNASGTAQQAEVLATVTDANANPVKGVTVNFNRTADPSGGNLSSASQVTDSRGQASVQYIAGGSTTASNGVKLRASVASAPTVFGNATLTVNQSALFIALGTGNTISNLDDQTYQKDWVVYVTDSNSIAVPNVTLTIKVLPQEYGKGSLTFNNGWKVAAGAVSCPNEDANFNGVLDAGEDANHNGTLEPGNVISVTPGVVKTDSNGRATISLIYAESYAPWMTVRLRAEAVVAGTESSKESIFTVAGSSADFSNEDVPPAGAISPFGTNGCGTAN